MAARVFAQRLNTLGWRGTKTGQVNARVFARHQKAASGSWLQGRLSPQFQPQRRSFSADTERDPRMHKISDRASRVMTMEEDAHGEAQSSVDGFADPNAAIRTQFRSKFKEEHRYEEGPHSKQISRTHFFHAERVSLQQPASRSDAPLSAFKRTEEHFDDAVQNWTQSIRQHGDSDSTTVARQRGPRQAVRSPSLGQFRLPAPGAQRCVAYCTAEAYDFDILLKALQKTMVCHLLPGLHQIGLRVVMRAWC
eukprot:3169278-Rhodomonas_salina.2